MSVEILFILKILIILLNFLHKQIKQDIFLNFLLAKKRDLAEFKFWPLYFVSINWGRRSPHLCRVVKTPNTTSVLDKTLNRIRGETPVLDVWWRLSSPSLPLLSDSLWPGVIVPIRVTSIDQIEIFNHLCVCKQKTAKLNYHYYYIIIIIIT